MEQFNNNPFRTKYDLYKTEKQGRGQI